MVIRT